MARVVAAPKCWQWRQCRKCRNCGISRGVTRMREADAWSWIGSIGLGIAVGVAYLLAAHLSLTLLTKPDCVAVFWPAAGIASGTLIALGPKARVPVALGSTDRKRRGKSPGATETSRPPSYSPCAMPEKPYW